MTERCACAAWEGTDPHHVAIFPDDAFETLVREDLGDYHGAVPHRGRLRCRTCGATFAYLSELTSTIVTRESEIDRVLACLRDGKVAQVGGGRSFSTYGIRDGQPIVAASCDGEVEEHVVSEERMRELIEGERVLFVEYLRIWRG